MTAQDFIIELFCKVDDQMAAVAKHSQASLWPSEVTTIGLLHSRHLYSILNYQVPQK